MKAMNLADVRLFDCPQIKFIFHSWHDIASELVQQKLPDWPNDHVQ